MGQLIISEFERLWSRWSIRLLVLTLPLLVIVTGVYFQNHNRNRSMDAVDYATALNFPILSISEHLFITFNILLIFICAYVITEEYQQKQIKLIVLRAYSMSQIFLSKFIVMATSLFICFFLYYLASFTVGQIMFEMPERSILFVSEAVVTNAEMVLYALNYYGIAFLTSLAALSLFCFIAILMPSVNALLGSGICILFFFDCWSAAVRAIDRFCRRKQYFLCGICIHNKNSIHRYLVIAFRRGIERLANSRYFVLFVGLSWGRVFGFYSPKLLCVKEPYDETFNHK